MAIPTKKYFADRIVLGLQNAYPNIDFRGIQPREVFRVIDDIVNSMARDNYLNNWKLGVPGFEEFFITTWSGASALNCVDVENQQSYLTFPAVYAALPMNAGIIEIWPLDFEYGAVKIRQHEDIRRTRHLMSGNMQGELGGYPKGTIFEFDQVNVKKNFGEKFGMRLAIKDSSLISETDPYPIHSDLVEEVIKRGIIFFTEKRNQVTDVVRDKQDAINRN